uniref:GTP-binding protein Di-Ras2 n=1 Tax=Gongylonema pulchrum TaxID=637853 RepID=A0A183CWT0_9BILA
LIVGSVDLDDSISQMVCIKEQIIECRSTRLRDNSNTVPMLFAINKTDLPSAKWEIDYDEIFGKIFALGRMPKLASASTSLQKYEALVSDSDTDDGVANKVMRRLKKRFSRESSMQQRLQQLISLIQHTPVKPARLSNTFPQRSSSAAECRSVAEKMSETTENSKTEKPSKEEQHDEDERRKPKELTARSSPTKKPRQILKSIKSLDLKKIDFNSSEICSSSRTRILQTLGADDKKCSLS